MLGPAAGDVGGQDIFILLPVPVKEEGTVQDESPLVFVLASAGPPARDVFMLLPLPVKAEGKVKVELSLVFVLASAVVGKGNDGVPGTFGLGLDEACGETFAAFPPAACHSRILSSREGPLPLGLTAGGFCRVCVGVGEDMLLLLPASPVYKLLPLVWVWGGAFAVLPFCDENTLLKTASTCRALLGFPFMAPKTVFMNSGPTLASLVDPSPFMDPQILSKYTGSAL